MVVQVGVCESKFVMTSCERAVDAVSATVRITILTWSLTFISVSYLNLRLEWQMGIGPWSYGGKDRFQAARFIDPINIAANLSIGARPTIVTGWLHENAHQFLCQ